MYVFFGEYLSTRSKCVENVFILGTREKSYAVYEFEKGFRYDEVNRQLKKKMGIVGNQEPSNFHQVKEDSKNDDLLHMDNISLDLRNILDEIGTLKEQNSDIERQVDEIHDFLFGGVLKKMMVEIVSKLKPMTVLESEKLVKKSKKPNENVISTTTIDSSAKSQQQGKEEVNEIEKMKIDETTVQQTEKTTAEQIEPKPNVVELSKYLNNNVPNKV